jgi:hypothetical protein
MNSVWYAERASTEEVWSPVRALTELNGDGSTFMASLTEDELTIYFNSTGSGSTSGSDRTLWTASRISIDEPFFNVRPLDELNCPQRQYAPWIVAEGLTIYFASNRDDVNNYYIYKASRNSPNELFNAPEKVFDGIGTATTAPYISPDERILYFYDELPDEPQKGTWKMEWVPIQEDCLPR